MGVTETQLHALIRAQALPPKQAQALAQALGHDPSRVPVTCEADGCGAERMLCDMFSFLSVLAMTGPEVAPGKRLAAIQCGAEQHYGCSLEHAALAQAQCIARHIGPAHAQHVQQAEGRDGGNG